MSEHLAEFHPGAEIDLLDGFEWYADRNPEAARDFRGAVQTARRVISQAPEVWPPYTNGTQKYRLRRFPYKIIYRCTEERIQIIAVAHDKRRPNYWVDRVAK